jgi:hypothetical protein
MLWIYHHVTGEPGHWEGRHYSLDEIPTSGYTAYDIWVPHCERHPAVPRPCSCEGSSLGIDEGPEA